MYKTSINRHNQMNVSKHNDSQQHQPLKECNNIMLSSALSLSLTKLVLFICRLLFKLYKNYHRKGLHRTFSNSHSSSFKAQRQLNSLAQRSDLSDKTLILDVEGALFRSTSLFPYFMLVAFEAGGILRAFILFITYPILCLLKEDVSIKVMVMICFFGIRKDSFRVGSAVLPKFFMENVCLEGFEVMKRGKRRVGVSNMPRVMVESFLKDYLEFDFVVGRELKVAGGYFVGLMEDGKDICGNQYLNELLEDEKVSSKLIGIKSSNKSSNHHWFSHCKEVYIMTNRDKSKWGPLPRERYPKTLIFHDGRLAFTPTPLYMFSMFMWFPIAVPLSIIRAFIALSLPFSVAIPILAFSGMGLKLEKPKYPFRSAHLSHKPKGLLYVCNHRTLLDPLFLSFGLKKQFAAVTYSLSRTSEILSPIRTVRLTRDRDQDAKMMEKLLNQGDLVVCPEGTTCREPYLLRFSPLFTELSDDIVPVALDTNVSMFYGTTASGLKCLDPFFFLMNPCPLYTVRFLEKVHGATDIADNNSRFDVANYVQSELGKALGFECTNLTRKDKYLILAGNEGVVSQSSKV